MYSICCLIDVALKVERYLSDSIQNTIRSKVQLDHNLQPRRPPDARLLLIGPRLRLRPLPGMDAWTYLSLPLE